MRLKIVGLLKRYFKYILLGACLLAVLILELAHHAYVSKLSPQQFVGRWDSKEPFAQVSCFFPEDAGMTGETIMGVERGLAQAMQEASIDTSGADGRTLVDAYSVEETLYVSSLRDGTEVRAFGVSKDFFLFHPLELLDGTYFTREDEASDGIILDENVAWQLFGSSHVAGLPVTIGDATYMVRGVVRADEGHFSEAAKESIPTVYVDFDTMEKLMAVGDEIGGSSYAVDCYELLIKNPVSDFGTTTLEKVMETCGITDYEMVENSTRFEVTARWNRLKNFGARSMNAQGIIYPYWENRARAYEDVSTLLLVLELLLLCYPAVMLGRGILLVWRKRKAIKEFLKNKISGFFFGIMAPNAKKLYKDVYKSRKTKKNKVE